MTLNKKSLLLFFFTVIALVLASSPFNSNIEPVKAQAGTPSAVATISAVEHWRRSLTDEERKTLSVPLSFYLNTLEYTPETASYFSEILKDAKKGNPEKYNETLKEHFQFEVKKEPNGLMAYVYSLQPMPHLKLLGNLGKLGILENFEEGISPEGNVDSEKKRLLKNFQISQISQNSQMLTCGDCRFWNGFRCQLHPEWVTVTPVSRACERFEPRRELAGEP